MEKTVHKRSILAIFVVAVLACVAAISVIFALPALADETEPVKDPVAIIHLGKYGMDKGIESYEANFEDGWSRGLDLAKTAYRTDTDAYVKFVLEDNWVAKSEDDDPYKSFGSLTGYFDNGRLLIPASVNVTIDLKGHNIDRQLDEATAYGQVILVNGNLNLEDSSTSNVKNQGKITGGYETNVGESLAYSSNYAVGGGILVSGGKLNIYGGQIVNHKIVGSYIVGNGIGVYNGTVKMYGGRIADNDSTDVNTVTKTIYGGGVGVYTYGSFAMSGGVIENNVAVFGGGIAAFNAAVTTPTITVGGDAVVTNNTVKLINGATHCGGGGVCVYHKGNMQVTGGEISYNRSENRGAGVYVCAGQDGESIFNMEGGSIHHNVNASLTAELVGGGLDLRRNSSKATVRVIGTLKGGSIDHNYVLGNCEKQYYPSTTTNTKNMIGAGVSLYYSKLTIGTDPEADEAAPEDDVVVAHNRIQSMLESHANAEDLETVIAALMKDDLNTVAEYTSAGYRAFGGGIHVLTTTGISDEGYNGVVTMYSGRVENNYASSGGGFNLEGYINLFGGTVTNNYANHGAGLYLTSLSRVSLGGSPVISGNKSIIDGQTASNLEVASHDYREPKIVKELTNESDVHLYTTESMIDQGIAITSGYGDDNSMFVAVTGADKDKAPESFTQKDGALVYANPHRYFTGDTVISASTSGKNHDENTLTEQHFVIVSKVDYNGQTEYKNDNRTYVGNIAVIPSAIVYTVEYQNAKGQKTTREFTLGENLNKDDLDQSLLFNYTTSDYGDEYYPVKVTARYGLHQYEQVGSETNGTPIYDYVREYDGGPKALDYKEKTLVISEDGEKPTAGVYTLEVPITPEFGQIGSSFGKINYPSYTAFHVVVKAQKFDNDSLQNGLSIVPKPNGEDGAEYDEEGNIFYVYDRDTSHSPLADVTFTVPKSEDDVDGTDTVITLIQGVDYELAYDRNKNAGNGILIVNFKGNYQGTATVNFSIKAAKDTEIETQVTWEYFDGSSWVQFNSDSMPNIFTFDGTDQSAKIHAVLHVEGDDYVDGQTIYSEHAEVEDAKRNTSMWLDYSVDGESGPFVNGGTYTVTVMGESNYPLAEAGKTITGLVMKKIELTIPSSDYADYVDGAGAKLWKLQIGLDGESTITELLDEAIYVDEEAKENEFGERVVDSSKDPDGSKYKYARYRGVPLKIVLNYDYALATYGKTLADLIALGELSYNTDDNGYVGEPGKVSSIDTVATIALNPSNYVIKDGEGKEVAGAKIEIKREWLIVTMSNALRKITGDEIESSDLDGWTFGDPDSLGGEFFRAEHGNAVIYSYYYAGTDTLVEDGQFALVYSDDTSRATRRFYGVMTLGNDLVPDTSNPIPGTGYLYNFNYTLRAGSYRLEVTVPANEPASGEHTHWWEKNATADDNGTRYYQFTYKFNFKVNPYELGEDDLANGIIKLEFPENNYVEYNGYNNNYVSPTITLFDSMVLQEGVDYTLYSDDIDVGWATLKFVGKNSVLGSFEIENAFRIEKAQNRWAEIPNIGYWMFNSFDRTVNLLKAKPSVKLAYDEDMWFEITTDPAGTNPVSGLEKFYIDEGYHVNVDIEALLNALPRGIYYLVAHVDERENGNYSGLRSIIDFQVMQAHNSWAITPSVNAWTEGEFKKTDDHILFASAFGTPHVVIVDDAGNVVYDNFEQIDRLAKAKAGRYTLTAEVAADSNYYQLELYTVVFSIFEKPGLPWWVTLVVAVGALLIVALVLFILWKKGVFQILTEKIVVSIRTKATVDATIAAVRAAKMAEDGKKSVADAKRRARIEAARTRAQAERALSPEERAAKLEAKAKAEEERAEKIRAHVEATRAKAAKMRDSAHNANAPKDNAQTPETETPTTETPTEE
ncbi:MAG: hypothetical protein J1F33_05760 [Clostridiales bacterium]|nr:hypothetical protein [Clostridiales bacterium]